MAFYFSIRNFDNDETELVWGMQILMINCNIGLRTQPEYLHVQKLKNLTCMSNRISHF